MARLRGWKRNRILLAILIIIAVIIVNVPGFTIGQILSLMALLVLIFFLYVRYFNRY